MVINIFWWSYQRFVADSLFVFYCFLIIIIIIIIITIIKIICLKIIIFWRFLFCSDVSWFWHTFHAIFLQLFIVLSKYTHFIIDNIFWYFKSYLKISRFSETFQLLSMIFVLPQNKIFNMLFRIFFILPSMHPDFLKLLVKLYKSGAFIYVCYAIFLNEIIEYNITNEEQDRFFKK